MCNKRWEGLVTIDIQMMGFMSKKSLDSALKSAFLEVKSMLSNVVEDPLLEDPLIEEKFQELDRSDQDVQNLQEYKMESDAEPEDNYYPEPYHLSFNLTQS